MHSANIRIGEILKLSKQDPFPSLEVSVELENGKLDPELEFLYLHDVATDLLDVKEKFMYQIERLAWADNIGSAYIMLDFDKSKKYRILFLRKVPIAIREQPS
mmetsp:Transcript_12211/g.8887  ORF Transcript_12211/g.8887 Transcript_12211/m.8887 type:complete len:103 (+) Transcript_12211:115-423(+)